MYNSRLLYQLNNIDKFCRVITDNCYFNVVIKYYIDKNAQNFDNYKSFNNYLANLVEKDSTVRKILFCNSLSWDISPILTVGNDSNSCCLFFHFYVLSTVKSEF